MTKRFAVAMRDHEKSTYLCNQYAVMDKLENKWTPMAVFPRIAEDYRDLLNDGLIEASEFEWYQNDHCWDYHFRDPTHGKFGFLITGTCD